MTPGELVAAARVQGAAFGQTPPPAPGGPTSPPGRRRGRLRRRGHRARHGRVVGTGTCSAVRRGFGEIAGNAVDEARRGRRVASSLTAALARWARAAGADLVFLNPGERPPPAATPRWDASGSAEGPTPRGAAGPSCRSRLTRIPAVRALLQDERALLERERGLPGDEAGERLADDLVA
ncbi:MAG: GNAT family N-acetyltransferase, partial [Acidimicrobiales bacterium]